MEKVEQVQSLLKQIGFDDDDLKKIGSEDVEDFTPFLEKAKSSFKSLLTADTTFVDELVKPYKDAPIGKEKQLKKQIRTYFNLQIKEDDLAKMTIPEILETGTSALKATDNSEIEKYKQSYSSILEEYEALKNEIPNKLKEVEDVWKSKFQAKEIHSELMKQVATGTSVPKENIDLYATTFHGYLKQRGLALDLEKNSLKLKDADGLPARDEKGGILHLKDMLKEFSDKMQTNVKPTGTANIPASTNTSTRTLLSTMGKGFQIN